MKYLFNLSYTETAKCGIETQDTLINVLYIPDFFESQLYSYPLYV